MGTSANEIAFDSAAISFGVAHLCDGSGLFVVPDVDCASTAAATRKTRQHEMINRFIIRCFELFHVTKITHETEIY